MSRAVKPLVALLCIALVGGCTLKLDDPLPLAVTMTVTPANPAKGDTVVFAVSGQGDSVLGFVLEYGDESVDSVSVGLSRTAQMTRRHQYAAAGSYQAIVTIVDGVLGSTSTSKDIVVH